MGVTREGNQFLMMLYKGMLLRKRHYFVTLFEILIPILMAIIPVILCYKLNPYQEQPHTKHDATTYPPFSPYDAYASSNTYILYTPSSSLGTDFINKVVDRWDDNSKEHLRRDFVVEGFTTEDLLVERSVNIRKDKHSSYVIGIVLKGFLRDDLPSSLEYDLRLGDTYNTYSFPTTESKYPPSIKPRKYDEYKSSGFLSWQAAIEQTFIALNAKNETDLNYELKMQRFPFPPYRDDTNLNSLFTMIQSIIIYCYIVIICILAKRLVEEKANHSRELLRMMGMTDCVYWMSSFVNVFGMVFIVSAFITIMFKIPFKAEDSNPGDPAASVINKTDGFLLFVILLLYSSNLIVFCMAVSRFINKAIWAVVLVLITVFIPYSVLMYTIFTFDEKYMSQSTASKLAICLHPSGAYLVVFKLIATFEQSGVGVQWSNMTSYGITDNVNMAQAMAMMLVSLVLYSVITWYVDMVWPWQDGVPKPLYFPFTFSYWFGQSHSSINDIAMPSTEKSFFESDPTGATPGIIVRHLKKSFRMGFHSKTVIEDISVNIYNGQITALLGQNGAGKTTTISILTGMYTPDDGSALISGFDIRTQTVKARQNLGICPQENILYDTLSVREHLQFYAGIKGTPFRQLSQVATETMKLLGLTTAENRLARQLSGGMKRKLSLAIALVADSKVLFLDEPTSGLDPESRRVVWDILLSIRHDKTIILTTHYMEEADILGDRILIMSGGKIKCCGSPMFLKRQFGAGYSLHIVKQPSCKPTAVTDFLLQHIQDIVLEDDSETELVYSFPSGTTNLMLGNMFTALEGQLSSLDVSSFGLTVTTMDDVFLKVVSLDDATLLQTVKKGGESNAREIIDNGTNDPGSTGALLMSDSEKVMGLTMFFNQLRSILIKRFNYSKRFYSVIFSQVIYPFLIILILALLLRKMSGGGGSQSDRLELDPKIAYGATKGFVTDNSSGTLLMRDYYEPLLSEYGVTMTRTDDPANFILEQGETNLRQYLTLWLFGGSTSKKGSSNMLELRAWYNGQPYHAMPISLNVMHNALLRYYGTDKKARILATNAPLPETSRRESSGPVDSMLVMIFSSTFFPLALCTLFASYVFVPVIERATKAKLLQLLTGLSWFVYWLGMFLWDILCHFVASVILILPFAFFCADIIFAQPDAAGSILLLLLLGGWNFIPLCYVLSHGFKNSNTASNVISSAAFVVAIVPTPIIALLFVNNSSTELLIGVWFLRLLPSFTVSWGLAKTMSVSYYNMFCDMISPDTLEQSCSSGNVPQSKILMCCPDLCKKYNNCFQKKHPLAFDNQMAGIDALVLFISGCLYFALLALLESGLLGRLWQIARIRLFPKKYSVTTIHVSPATDQDTLEDSDVMNERERLDQQAGFDAFEREALVAMRLSKCYGQLCAVDDLTFAVHREECFGLLGVNGAGKTSTFKMLTGDIRPTKGNAYIGQYNICTSLKTFQSYLGYCPQFDPLLDRLTGREMLNLFAALRGIAFNSAPNVVNEIIKNVGLEEHADKETRIYSGGNKRKLSLALAIIGCPPVILLDEPSSGVDPVSRRKIWKVLERVRETSGSSIILCTHSMEECEYLCERLAIMVNGKFKCLGSIQHLKSKFGQGYMVTIKPKKETEDNQEAVTAIIIHFQNVFHGSVLRDKNQGILQLQVTDTSIPWSRLFKEMEQMKQDFGIEDYLISGTTLEQIFLTFAKSQRVSDQHV